MARIGMIGTSHTQGCQPVLSKKVKHKDFYQLETKKFTKYLDEHLKKSMPEHDFFNLGKSGRGTERYLESIVYLKKKFDIDFLLLEYAENRKNNAFYCSEIILEERLLALIKDKSTIDLLVEDIIANNEKYVTSINSLYNEVSGILESIPVKKVKHWKEVCAVQFYDSLEPRILGLKDIQQSYDLCKMLDIKVVPWTFYKSDDILNTNNIFNKFLNKTNIDKNMQYCDGFHASNIAYEKGSDEFFKPLINAM